MYLSPVRFYFSMLSLLGLQPFVKVVIDFGIDVARHHVVHMESNRML